MATIFTERLVLRKACEDDLEAMHRILSDPRTMRYWSSLPHAELEETRVWLSSMIESPSDISFDFIIDHQGETIGKAGFHRLPEIGYILHPDHWGRGFAAEALSAVISEAFERFDLPAIKADIDPRNSRSIRLLERLGFSVSGRAERTFRLGDEWCDSLYFELKRPSDMPQIRNTSPA